MLMGASLAALQDFGHFSQHGLADDNGHPPTKYVTVVLLLLAAVLNPKQIDNEL
jgi:hypothetical protein